MTAWLSKWLEIVLTSSKSTWPILLQDETIPSWSFQHDSPLELMSIECPNMSRIAVENYQSPNEEFTVSFSLSYNLSSGILHKKR